MGCTKEAIDVFEESRMSSTSTTKGIQPLKMNLTVGVWYGPGKAANCGGVAVSGLEMAQNSQRLAWTSEEVDAKLAKIMESAFNIGIKTATEYTKTAPGAYPSLVAGLPQPLPGDPHLLHDRPCHLDRFYQHFSQRSCASFLCAGLQVLAQ